MGVLFKIMHWSGADELLLYPFIVLFCIYCFHFVRKKPIRRVDILKVLTFLTFLATPPFVVLHLISEENREVLIIVSTVLLWVTFLDFVYTTRKDGVLLNK